MVVANHDITATGVAVLHHAAANWNHSPVTRRGRQVNSPDYLDCIITNARDDLGLTEPRDLELMVMVVGLDLAGTINTVISDNECIAVAQYNM